MYEPRSCTTQVRKASRPTEAVTFPIGYVNFGSTRVNSKKKTKKKTTTRKKEINQYQFL